MNSLSSSVCKNNDNSHVSFDCRLRKKFKQIMSEDNPDTAFSLFKSEFGGLEMLNSHAAGIDIASEENWVALPESCGDNKVRCFGSSTPDLKAIRDFLLEHKITTVAMESTGIYWICLYDILEESGINVSLVNARQLKSVKGRPKTDRLDCRWLQRLHSYGLLNDSFRPEGDYVAIRSLSRYRHKLIEDQSTHILRMGKALTEMNILLPKAVSDITGMTGMRIINAILSGVRDPKELAKLRDRRCKHSEEAIADFLTGYYKDEQLLILKTSLNLYQVIAAELNSLDKQLSQLFEGLHKIAKASAKQKTVNVKKKDKYRVKAPNAPNFDVYSYSYELTGVDLSAIPGFSFSTILGVIAEVGNDMTHWESAGHFRSWLGVSPKPKISGGKVHGKEKLNQSRAACHFRNAAATLSRSNSYIGDFYRRMRAKKGGKYAITATAAKLATIYYEMVKNKEEFKGVDVKEYKNIIEEKNYRSILRRAKQAGFKLVAEKQNALDTLKRIGQ